jgi:hypothetical protein
LAKSLEIAGNVASFGMWQRSRGFDGKVYATRERLWEAESGRFETGRVTVLEFGVAHGDATRFWLSMLPNAELRWHGFDTFEGLPEAWMRGGVQFAGRGLFDAGGKPPDIADPRVTWHPGRIDKTLPAADVDYSSRLCVLFDMDLYGPSAFALTSIGDKLKPGDVLYFDEAYDPEHERRALDEFLDRGYQVRVVGSTGIALMVEVV